MQQVRRELAYPDADDEGFDSDLKQCLTRENERMDLKSGGHNERAWD